MRNVSSAAKTLSLVDASMREPLLGREDYSRNLAAVTVLFNWLDRFTLRNNRDRVSASSRGSYFKTSPARLTRLVDALGLGVG
jgi:hypothetical protein